MPTATNSPIDILLINSQPAEVEVARRVLSNELQRRQVHAVESGEDALRFLRREGDFMQAPRPKLVLLDSRLPGISALDVLHAINQDTSLRSIPVVFFTGTNADADALAAYDERARAVIVLPVGEAAFEDVLHRLADFWLSTAQLPEE